MRKPDTLKTLNVLALASLACYLFFGSPWLSYLCAFFLVLTLFDNPLARFTAGAWMKFGAIIGNVNSRIILGLVFYLLLTPLALLYRLFNRRAAGHFTADTRDTLFEDVPEAASSKENFEKPW